MRGAKRLDVVRHPIGRLYRDVLVACPEVRNCTALATRQVRNQLVYGLFGAKWDSIDDSLMINRQISIKPLWLKQVILLQSFCLNFRVSNRYHDKSLILSVSHIRY